MTQTTTLINKTTDTWDTLVNKVNELANLASNTMVTANNNANGSITTGNVYGVGIFTYSTVTAETAIRGGNVQSSAVLTCSSNLFVTGVRSGVGNTTVNTFVNSSGYSISNSTVTYTFISPTSAMQAVDTYFLNADGTWTQVGEATETTTTGTSAQEIKSWLKSAYYSAVHTVAVNDEIANNRQHSQLSVLHDESPTVAYISEFGVVESNSVMGTYTANSNVTHVRIWYTPVSTSTTVKVVSSYVRK